MRPSRAPQAARASAPRMPAAVPSSDIGARRAGPHRGECRGQVGLPAPRLADLARDGVAPARRQGGHERHQRGVVVRRRDGRQRPRRRRGRCSRTRCRAPRRPPRSSAMPSSAFFFSPRRDATVAVQERERTGGPSLRHRAHGERPPRRWPTRRACPTARTVPQQPPAAGGHGVHDERGRQVGGNRVLARQPTRRRSTRLQQPEHGARGGGHGDVVVEGDRHGFHQARGDAPRGAGATTMNADRRDGG